MAADRSLIDSSSALPTLRVETHHMPWKPDETAEHSSLAHPGAAGLPSAPIERWVLPFARFFRIEAASGFVLLGCTIVALILANSIWADEYFAIWQTEITLGIGQWQLSHSLGHWITDGLMTIFFFIVGLEIKRELVAGELRDPRKAALPAMAAIGGMLVPAGIFLLLQGGEPGQAGWGIPIATDIAFVVALLAIFGTRVSPGLKIFVLSLAIADDVGAVLVIAIFFASEHISFAALGVAAVGFGLTYAFNRMGVRRVPVYVLVGIGIWLAFLDSGVHPTLAGVLLGLLTPASAWVGDRAFFNVASDVLKNLRGRITSNRERQQSLGQLATTAYEAVSPLERLEYALHPWVAFAIIPLFALANVGVVIDPRAMGDPLVIAVAAGLFFGKPIGIVLFAYLAVRIGIARLPAGVNWRIMIAAGCLAGIGFTMSLLIAGLALGGTLLEAGKIGTLIGSLLSALLAATLLLAFLPKRSAEEAEPEDEFDAAISAA